MRSNLAHDARTRRVHGVVHVGDKVNAAVRKLDFGEGVAYHLETVAHGMPVLERVNHGNSGGNRGILLHAIQELLEGRLDFAQALARRKRHVLLTAEIVERESQAAQFQCAVAKQLGLFGPEDGFIARLADSLDFLLENGIECGDNIIGIQWK